MAAHARGEALTLVTNNINQLGAQTGC